MDIPAGQTFRIKMIEAFGAGSVVGLTTITFAIWDVDNNVAAAYEYLAVVTTFGTPISKSGEGEWSDTFQTHGRLQVDQFGGVASHAQAGALVLGVMKFNFGPTPVVTVDVPTGFTTGGGVDAGAGMLRFLPGTAKAFTGAE